MIVEFSVKNFRSIFDLQTISFRATNLNSSKDNIQVDENNIYQQGGQRLLKTIGIYGANASGKSNIIKALEYFCEAIRALPSPESRLSRLAQPFIYQENFEHTASFFQIIIIVDDKKYRYGFTVKKNLTIEDGGNASSEVITNEWLFGPKNVNQVKYFTRKGLDIDKSNLPGSENVAPLEYEHTLFLTHVASYSKSISAKIRHTINGFITSKFSLRSDYYRFHSIRQIENDDSKQGLIGFLRSFGLDYKNIYYKNRDEFKKQNKYPLEQLFLTKVARHDNSNEIVLNMEENESDGTKKLFDLAGLILHAFNIDTSGLIILDEIDSNFHPSLLINLIGLFNNPQINRANAQLLFTSHDTNLMNPTLMRRDQFYLTEKEENEATRLYALAELKGIRNDADFAKHYLAGFYGSLPIPSQFIYEKTQQYDGPLGS